MSTRKDERLIFDFSGDADAKWEKLLLRCIQVPHTRRELEIRLRQKHCPEEIAAKLLDRFEEIGLIDDRTYAVLYVDSKKTYGVRRLRDELLVRGVSRDIISEVLDESDIDETERALAQVRQWENLPGMTPEKAEGRLLRRGFSSSAVRDALDTLRDEGSRIFEKDSPEDCEY
jgi:regulatory protein